MNNKIKPLDSKDTEFIARSNHTSPLRIDGVGEGKLVNQNKTSRLCYYTICGMQKSIQIDEEEYRVIKNLMDDLNSIHEDVLLAFINQTAPPEKEEAPCLKST